MLAVIIPAYNRPDQLREALTSLTVQTKKRFITIVCDDASTEDLHSIVQEFNDKLTLVYLRLDENGGPGAARQKGLDWAIENNMESIMFLDSDDILFPNAVEVLSYELNHGRFDFVASNISVESKNNPQNTITAENSITWFHGKIYRVSYLRDKHIHFTEGLRTNEDLAFNLSAYWSTENCSYIDTTVYLWRDDKNSITRGPTQMKYDAAGIDYIRAIYAAFQYAKDNIPNFNFKYILPNLFMCYDYFESAIELGQYVPYSIDEQIEEMLTYPKIAEICSYYRNWIGQDKYIWGYCIGFNKDIILFSESFGDWYLNHGGTLPEVKNGSSN